MTGPRQLLHLASWLKLSKGYQQQGDYYPDHPQRYNINIGQQYSNIFDMDTSPMNPHADIHRTGRHEVFIREVEMCIDGQVWIKTLACIYTPDGKCRYTLTPERTAILYQQYRHSTRHKPKVMRKLKAGRYLSPRTVCPHVQVQRWSTDQRSQSH